MNLPTDPGQPTADRVVVRDETPQVVERVTVTRVQTAHLAKPDTSWTWSDLRDYVVSQIQRIFGEVPRDPVKEAGVFKRFMADWGPVAPMIARHAFTVCGGYWHGAPIGVGRFCKASDPYFAVPIAERLAGDS